MFKELLANQVLQASLVAWLLAQLLKVPIEYLSTRRTNWSLLLSAGGMPSSHSALVVSVATSIGLNAGFDTAAFALAIVLAMIVTYDASGIRRQAGLQAEKINAMIDELLKGKPISENQLKEVLGHTHRQVLAGALLGVIIALLFWLIYP
jgi:acid phosphatase family membrane protein YuiD